MLQDFLEPGDHSDCDFASGVAASTRPTLCLTLAGPLMLCHRPNKLTIVFVIGLLAAFQPTAGLAFESSNSEPAAASESEAPGNNVDVNRMCPVLSNEEAIAEYSVMYKGKEVRFCCSECIIEFNKHPEIYENVLPQLRNLTVLARAKLWGTEHKFTLLVPALLSILIALRIGRQRLQTSNGYLAKLVTFRTTATIPLMAISGFLGFEVWQLQQDVGDRALKDEIHFATFHDFGFPPTPREPALEPRLKGSFYRGNDERSPRLFNNGNYRTATFHISLVNDKGDELKAGDQIAETPLFVRFQIDRPPFTPDFLYNQEMMDTMFLTEEVNPFLGRSERVADLVSLTETDPMQAWEARFPIESCGTCECSKDRTGTVYVCEKYFKMSRIPTFGKQQVGGRYHYGIRYELKTEDGVLLEDSNLYMGALYRTRKLPTWRVPMTEWFSYEPIPVLPGENVEDAELLGIKDHAIKQQG